MSKENREATNKYLLKAMLLLWITILILCISLVASTYICNICENPGMVFPVLIGTASCCGFLIIISMVELVCMKNKLDTIKIMND